MSDNNGAINKDTVQVTVNASANQLPVANAGADKVITLPTNTNTLSGSGTDANGTISSYAWVSISGPSTGTIATANAAATAINNLLQGVYKYELTVSDNNGAINKDTVQVTVNASANQPPVANAGADKNISLPTNTVTLDGVATDANGTISSYKWVKISGPAKGTIAKSNAASTSVNNLLQGIYQYQLSVTDNNGAIGKDTVQITINAAMNTLMNTLPVAKGGTDKTITLPINTVTLSGSGTDANGTISSYGWAKISGPATGAISKTSAATTDINSLLQGVYQYELTVTNNKGAKGKDTVQVIVNARLIEAPVVNAGVDKIITLPTNTITLEGRATDAKSAISSYAWVKISGPSTGTIATANEATTVVNNMVQGVYIFELSATNNLGASAKDTVQVKVNGVVVKNKLPTANAGADINIILPTDTAQITANAADADGTTTLYNWKVITGPTGYSIGNTNASHTTIKHLSEGVYDIELTVTNDHGDVAKDTLRLTVSAAIRLNYNAYSFQVYPNPVKDVANVKIAVNKGVSNAKVLLSVVNISGLVVKSKSLLTSGSSTIFKLDMADLIDGFYIIVLTFENGEKLTYKVVKHS